MNGKGIFGVRWVSVLLALVLSACGGGGDSSTCSSGVPGLCSMLGQKTTPASTPTAPTPSTVVAPTDVVFAIQPASITTGDCTTNIPFIFTGGTAPFTVYTSDNTAVPVTSAQPLGTKYFFLASIRSLFLSPDSVVGGVAVVIVPRKATVTVLDSQSHTATATIEIPLAHLTCPNSPLLQIEAASDNAHATEILAFHITGGTAPFSVVSSDASIVTVPANPFSATTFNAQATASSRTTQETALLTVTSSDGQKANIRFTVLPLQ